MDIDISRWILEFILWQPLSDTTLNALLSVLPLPNNDMRFKKVLILRKIESQVSSDSFSEKLLHLLELMEEIYAQEGIEPSEAMKSAYCAVAVECTVSCLKQNVEKFKYFKAVKRIWKKRINKMGNVGCRGLGSEELWKWRDDVEEALWDDKLCDNVVLRSENVVAVDAVKAFVKEAKERIGPSFLEVMAESLKRDGGVKACLGWEREEESGVPGRTIESLSGQDFSCCKCNGEGNKGNALARLKHVAFKPTRGTPAEVCRDVKIADSTEPGVESSRGQDDLLPLPKIEEAQEALKLSSLELRAVLKDPLPEALELAETLMSLDRDNGAQQPAKDDEGRGPQIVTDNIGVVRADGGKEDDQRSCHQSAVPKPSLMARNNTAHTFEWNDSIDNFSEGSTGSGRRFTLPSPRRMPVSPLKKYVFKKATVRRKPKRWSALEEDTLRSGVQKYGVGNWRLIFDTYREVFEDRTPADLKDKWRNLTS